MGIYWGVLHGLCVCVSLCVCVCVCVCVCRYLDDVSLHHLINALCSLSLEAMEMAYGTNKVTNQRRHQTVDPSGVCVCVSVFVCVCVEGCVCGCRCSECVCVWLQ